MGREAAANQNAKQAALDALLESVMGPRRNYGELTDCPKCGLNGGPDRRSRDSLFHVRWCLGTAANEFDKRRCTYEGEHLHLVCPRCGYSWPEDCADAPRRPTLFVPEGQ